MGNASICKKTVCSQPRPMYKTVISNIFNIALEKNKLDAELAAEENNPIAIAEREQKEIARLRAHVKVHIKGLIDYLETNHSKLAECGFHLNQRMTASFNPEIHALVLLICEELMKESKRFSYDKNFYTQLIQSKTSASKDNKDFNDPNTSFVNEYTSNSLTENLLQFEGSVVEILTFILDWKRPSTPRIEFAPAIDAFCAYSENHIGTLNVDKIETILDGAIAKSGKFENFSIKGDLDIHAKLIQIMSSLASIHNTGLRFKQKFVKHAYNVLKLIYKYNEHNQSVVDETGIGQAREVVLKATFSLLTNVAKSVYDINDLGNLINPLFVIFDSAKWDNPKLEGDIFRSIINSMKENSSLNQTEIFVVERVVEYLVLNSHGKISQAGPYKNNKDLNVKIKVLTLLESILDQINKPFLSFLVIDNVLTCFLANIEDPNYCSTGDCRLKGAIMKALKKFLEKIGTTSKSKSQVITAIVTEIHQKSLILQNFYSLAKHYFDFLAVTLDHIGVFPTQSLLPAEAIVALLKLRSVYDYREYSMICLEKLLDLKYSSEIESPELQNDLKTDFLTCNVEVAYYLLSDNLSLIKAMIEDKKRYQDTNFIPFGILLRHISRMNHSLLSRMDLSILNLMFLFFRKIMEIIEFETKMKEVTALLTCLTLDFIQDVLKLWNMHILTPKLSEFLKQLPQDSLSKLKKFENNPESKSFISELANTSSSLTLKKNSFEDLCKTITLNLCSRIPSASFSNSGEDFDNLAYQYNINCPYSLKTLGQDSFIENGGKSHDNSFMNFTAFNKKKTYHLESLASLRDYTPNQMTGDVNVLQIEPMNSSEPGPKNIEESDLLIDQSFQKQIDQARKEKAKVVGISKIIEYNNHV